MNPTVQAYATAYINSGTSLVINAPSGIQLNDILIGHFVQAQASGDGLSAVTIPSGWTLIREDDEADQPEYVRQTLCFRLATSADIAASNYTASIGSLGGGGRFSGAIARISYVAWSVPSNQNGARLAGGTSESYSMAITPSIANSLLLFFTSKSPQGDGNSASAYAIGTSNPTWTELYDINLVDGGAVVRISMTLAWAIRPQTTSTGTATATAAITSATQGVGVLLALRPATSFTQTDTLTHTEIASTGLSVTITDEVQHTEETIVTPSKQWNNDTKPTTNWTPDIK